MTRCGAVSQRIVQIHATRHCNLRCRHCYSVSGPRTREALAPEVIARFLFEARNERYTIASFSGGEPLLYPHFFECASTAAALGFGVTVTTNGMLVDESCAQKLAKTVDLVAVSIDGPPHLHNRMRASAAAFDGALRGMRTLRRAGIRFAVIHTITAESLASLRWLLEFSRDEGAALLQLHPLEFAGRAREELRENIPDSAVSTRASMLATILAATGQGNEPPIQLDVFNRDLIRAHPETVFADETGSSEDLPLSELVNPLVLEQNGDVVPIAYGFGREYRVCNVMEQPLEEALPEFKSTVYPNLRALCRRVYTIVLGEDDLPYFNWYDRLTQASCEATAPETAA